MPLAQSWLASANRADSDFPLNNLPAGVFSIGGDAARCGVAIGDSIVDLALLETCGLVGSPATPVFDKPQWNDFMALGPRAWQTLRQRLTKLLALGGDPHLRENPDLRARAVRPMAEVALHRPFRVAEFTDFYASRHHATNVGTMLRGPENALPPNWRHMPIGYNGRASSVVVSGTDIPRPLGQLKSPGRERPYLGPSERFDFELELGAVVGQPSDGPVSVTEADGMIFGYVLVNDWSARDIQAWEAQPLGPFQSKATATTISPWIVMREALAPFRVPGPERDVPLLDYLHEPGPMHYDIALGAVLKPEGAAAPTRVTETNYAEMYYSAAQQLAHHTLCGCPMRVGDLLGSGTISGSARESRGCLLERTWSGREPLALESGGKRAFLADGDTITLTGVAMGDGYRIGFGDATGRIQAAAGNDQGV